MWWNPSKCFCRVRSLSNILEHRKQGICSLLIFGISETLTDNLVASLLFILDWMDQSTDRIREALWVVSNHIASKGCSSGVRTKELPFEFSDCRHLLTMSSEARSAVPANTNANNDPDVGPFLEELGAFLTGHLHQWDMVGLKMFTCFTRINWLHSKSCYSFIEPSRSSRIPPTNVWVVWMCFLCFFWLSILILHSHAIRLF